MKLLKLSSILLLLFFVSCSDEYFSDNPLTQDNNEKNITQLSLDREINYDLTDNQILNQIDKQFDFSMYNYWANTEFGRVIKINGLEEKQVYIPLIDATGNMADIFLGIIQPDNFNYVHFSNLNYNNSDNSVYDLFKTHYDNQEPLKNYISINKLRLFKNKDGFLCHDAITLNVYDFEIVEDDSRCFHLPPGVPCLYTSNTEHHISIVYDCSNGGSGGSGGSPFSGPTVSGGGGSGGDAPPRPDEIFDDCINLLGVATIRDIAAAEEYHSRCGCDMIALRTMTTEDMANIIAINQEVSVNECKADICRFMLYPLLEARFNEIIIPCSSEIVDYKELYRRASLITNSYRPSVTDMWDVLDDVSQGIYIVNSDFGYSTETQIGNGLISQLSYLDAGGCNSNIEQLLSELDESQICELINLESYDSSEGEQCVIDGNCYPRNLVDFILENGNQNEDENMTLISNYLGEALGLTGAEQNWLASSAQSDLVTTIYNGLLDKDLGRCENEDCGSSGGYHELIKQSMAGKTLTSDDTEGLLDFFSILMCDNPEVYGCFREAQQNPDGDVAAFLNQAISISQSSSNFLVDACDDLTPYVDRWNDLAQFDPLSVQAVEDKLEELGDEYWIQTIDNATNANWWWEESPTVNMDFFGITITEFPTKPFSPFDQFSPEEFFDYIQDNFTTSAFMGDGNDCHSVVYPEFQNGGEFIPLSGAELFDWTGDNPVGSTFTINMFDDGSVMTTDFNEGENWTFSTLNAPGWLEGDSYDGFHPVSGNREFGITQNPDGSYTFYTSGVDRLTGWWHVLGPGYAIAFDEAEQLWKCFLDQIKSFVEGLGGSVSDNYNCPNVRPDLEALQELLKKGCGGDAESIEEFPCHQSEECQ